LIADSDTVLEFELDLIQPYKIGRRDKIFFVKFPKEATYWVF